MAASSTRPSSSASARRAPAAPPCSAASGASTAITPPHGDRLLQLHRNVPVVTIVVDGPDRVARSFEIVDEITRERGLVTSEMVPALAASHEGGRRGELRLARHRF